MSEPGFGALVIGDELLTGKRRDKHVPRLIEMLAERGLELGWATTVGDDPHRLQRALSWSLESGDVVFAFGGIGATPDDRTRQCAAAAAGVPLEINTQGRAELESVFGERAYPHRIRMVEWPCGATLIPNPVNRVPGFSFHGHHFVPGFPDMAWPMIEWVLDTHYVHRHQTQRPVEYRVEVLDVAESELIDVMESVMGAHPDVRMSCLPNARGRRAIEYGLRGRREAVTAAYRQLLTALRDRGVRSRALDHRE